MNDSARSHPPHAAQPPGQDGRRPDMHALRTPLTVIMLRAQILRRHLRRGDDAASLETELDQIDDTLAQLAHAIDQFDRDRRHEP